MLIAQPNLHASDLRDANTGKCLASNLCAKSAAAGVQSRFDVAEVVGRDMSVEDFRGYIEAACTEQGKTGWSVVDFKLDALPIDSREGRTQVMAATDDRLGQILSGTDFAGEDYTVVYFSSPHEAQLRNYESEYVESAIPPMELRKRSMEVVGEQFERRAAAGNSSAPLFVKYQFFTPGRFSISQGIGWYDMLT